MSDDRCKHCAFFAPYPETAARGKCHRYPPVYIGDAPMSGGRLETLFTPPPVDAVDWCGEFKPAKANP